MSARSALLKYARAIERYQQRRRERRARRPAAALPSGRWRLEALEPRLLLSAPEPHVFAVLPGAIVGPGQTANLPVVIAPEDFATTRGSVVLGFHVRTDPSSALDPAAALLVESASGAPVALNASRDDLPGSTDSLILADLVPGSYTLVVGGEGATTGAFEVHAQLIGDLDGNGLVDNVDRAAMTGLVSGRRYRAVADANRDGVLTAFDTAHLLRNLGARTTLNPLTLAAELDPGAAVVLDDGTGLTAEPGQRVVGQTSAGAMVELDADGDHVADTATTAGGTGAFALDVVLAEGPNALAVTSHDGFAQAAMVSLAITLDTTPPPVDVTLDPAFDTEPPGDLTTALAQVSLIGGTEPNATLTLLEGGPGGAELAAATADAAGMYRFDNVPLALGDNPFTVRAADVLGNAATAAIMVRRVPSDTSAPVISARLANDTGRADRPDTGSDALTSDPTVTGSVAGANAIVTFTAALDDGGAFMDALGHLGAGGRFSFDRAAYAALFLGGGTLADGAHTLRLQAGDEFGNVSDVLAVSFTLDTTPPIVGTPDLTPGSDTGASDNDDLTRDTLPDFAVNTEADALVTLIVDVVAVGLIIGGPPYVFEDVALGEGDHTVRARGTDLAGNTGVSADLAVVVDLTPPAVAPPDLRSTSDSGVSTNDDLTSDSTPTLDVAAEAGSAIDLLRGGQVVASGVAAGGAVTFTLAALADGPHTFQARATDAAGNANTSGPLAITIDTAPPGLALALDAASDTGVPGDDTTTLDAVTLIGTTEAGLPVALFAGDDLTTALANTTSDAAGLFGFAGIALSPGLNRFVATTADAAGNEASAGLTVTREQPAGVLLVEGTSFVVEHEVAITVPDHPATLLVSFDALSYDTADDFVNDAFEIALVDTAGRSLVHTVVPGSPQHDAAFNATEGEGFVLGANTQVAGQTVKIDLTHVPAGTPARVIARLVNNDADTQTSVRITDIRVVEDGGLGTPIAVAPPAAGAAIAVTPAIDVTRLSDVTASMGFAYGLTSFDAARSLLHAAVAIENRGTYLVDAPLLLVVDHLGEPAVGVVGADGVTPDGRPFFDLSAPIDGATLEPGESTGLEDLTFLNPGGVQFTYDLVVLGSLNHDPLITSSPEGEGLAGLSYRYDADAVDPDDDAVTFALTVGPEGMTVGASTGLVEWTPSAGDAGSHTVTLQATDGRGGLAEQSFMVRVRDDMPNRPPRITSTPTVDGATHTPYAYQVEAVDPDQDTLAFSLAEAPAGMTIGATTGLVAWTPAGNQLGESSVAVEVSDGHGGVAVQMYTVVVGGEQGNHAPVIVSDPVTGFALPAPSAPTSGQVDPRRIDLNLDAGEVFNGTVSITLPPEDAPTTDIVFVADVSGSMQGELDWIEGMVEQLDASLRAVGIGPNRFGFVSFGHLSHHVSTLLNAGTGQAFSTTDRRWTVSLYDRDGQPVLDKFNASAVSGVDFVTTADTLEFPVLLSGDYIAVVTSDEPDGTTPFSFKVRTTVDTVTPIALGDLIDAAIAQRPGKAFYSFTVPERTLVLADSMTTANFTSWALDGPDGNLVPSQPLVFSDKVLDLLPGEYRLSFEEEANQYDRVLFRIAPLAEALPITPGTPFGGQLNPGNKSHLYRFEGHAGEQYFFQSIGVSTVGVPNNATWRLIDPFGHHVFGDPANDARRLSQHVEPLTLTADGTYTLMVEGDQGQGGDGFTPGALTYTLNVQPVTFPSTPIALNATVTGEIAVPGQHRDHTFSLAQRALVYVDSLTNDPDLTWTLTGPTGVVEPSVAFSRIDLNPHVDRLEAGDYTLTVDGDGDATGAYAFRVVDLATAPPLTLGVPVSGTLLPASETDLFRFDALAGDAVSVTVLQTSDLGGAALRLVDPYGAQVFVSNGVVGEPAHTLAATGTYTLMIQGEPANTGADTYTVRVNLTGHTAPPPLTGAPLTLGATTSGTLPGAGLYTFTLPGPTVAYFDALTNNSALRWAITGPNGPVVTARPFTQADAPVFLEPGDHQLAITGTGALSFAFRLTALSQAQSINLGDLIAHDLTPGNETDLFRFQASAGDRLYLDSIAGPANAHWRLFDPFGASLTPAQTSLAVDIEVDPLPVDGTYTLAVEGLLSSTPAATYQVRVLPVTVGQSPLALGQTVSGTIASPGDQIVYAFDVADRTLGYFDSFTNSGNFRWTLTGPSGAVPGGSSVPFNQSPAGSPILDLVPGHYALTVDGVGASTGAFSFMVMDLAQAPTIALGATLSDTFAPTNETHAYRFAAQGGASIYLDTVSAVTQADFRIIDPFGQRVAGDNLTDLDTTQLHHSGLYTLLIEARQANTQPGPYQVVVHPVALTTEPLTVGRVVNGQIAGPGEEDRYTFSLAQRSLLFVDSLTTAAGMRWTLLDPSGAEVRPPGALAPADLSTLTLDLQPGHYTLVIDATGQNTGPYAFVLRDLAAATPLAPGTPVSAQLTPGLEADLYGFHAAAGDRLYFDAQGSTVANTQWKLIDPFGAEVFGATNFIDVDTVTLPVSGEYTLFVAGASSVTPGPYAFTVVPVVVAERPLALGQTVNGDLAAPGEEDLYTFDLAARTRVYFNPLVNDSAFLWTIAGPTGPSTERSFAANGLVTELAPGHYTLTVDGQQAKTGAYSFRLWDLAQAPAIAPGTPAVGAFTPALETDLYQFQAQAGDRFAFTVQAASAPNDARWQLIGPYGHEVFHPATLVSAGEQTLTIDGTYTLLLEPDRTSTVSRTYTILVDPRGHVALTPPTGTPMALGQTVSGNLSVAGEQDVYTFTVPERALVQWDALTNSPFRKSIVGPVGDVGAAIGFTTEEIFDLAPGDYAVTISATGSQTGPYQFRLLALADAQPIAFGTTVTGDLNPSRETDLYRFAASAGDHLYFDRLPGPNVSAAWQLLDPFGAEVDGTQFSSDLEPLPLPFDGVYTLRVIGAATNTTTGTYQFTVYRAPITTAPLVLGQTVSGDIATIGEQDLYTFTLAERAQLYFDLIATTGNVRWFLDGPTGRVVSNQQMATGENVNTLELAPGTYTLTVDGQATNTGTYRFRLLDVGAQPAVDFGHANLGVVDPITSSNVYRFHADGGTNVVFSMGDDFLWATTGEQARIAASQLLEGGGFEDGYDGLREALSVYQFRPGAARNFIFVSDEDRDALNHDLTFDSTLADILRQRVTLNGVLEIQLEAFSGATRALGVDSQGTTYFPDGAGGFTTGQSLTLPPNHPLARDYGLMMLATGGAVWDLGRLRQANQLTIQSFTQAFIAIKTDEIEKQLAIDVEATDPSVGFVNLTGPRVGVQPTETASFDVRFTGDGTAKSFDLQFVRAGSGNVLGSIPVRIMDDYVYPVMAIDPDGDALVYSLAAAPAGATIDAAQGLIHFRPDAPGQYDFLVRVDDGRGGIDEQVYVLTVTEGLPNDAPVITSDPVVEATALRPYTYDVAAGDANGDALTYQLTQFPLAMTIDAATGRIDWRPETDQVGTHTVTVRVIDGHGGTDTQTFDLTVALDSLNVAPVFVTTPIDRVEVGQIYLYGALATDHNGDPIVYDLPLKPRGMAIDPSSGVIVWRPEADQAGLQRVVLRAFDGRDGTALQVFDVGVVADNSAPVITSTVPSQAVAGLPFVYDVIAQDAEQTALTYSLLAAPAAMQIDPATGRVSWTPAAAQVGTHQATVRVDDGQSGVATQSFEIDVVAAAANHAPAILSTPRDRIGAERPYLYRLETFDADADPIAISLVTAPAGMVLDARGFIRWTPTAAQLGPSPLTIQVTDGRGGLTVQDVVITVVDTRAFGQNEPPQILSTAPTAATLDTLYVYDATATDADHDLLLWSLVDAPAGMSIDSLRGTVRWQPAFDQLGAHDVTVSVLDGLGLSDQQTFTLTVRSANTPPLITSRPPVEVEAGRPYVYAVTASDLENDPLAFSLIRRPAGMVIDPLTGVIQWTPSPLDLGAQRVTVRASDPSGHQAIQDFRILVLAQSPNASPVITSSPNTDATAGRQYQYAVTASDPENENLTFSLAQRPLGMVIDPSGGLIHWVPAAGQLGPHTVVVVATDERGASATQRFTVLAQNPNQLPVVTSAPVRTVTAGVPYRYDVRATDPDDGRLSFVLVTGPAGMQVDAAGRVTWSTGPAVVGTHPVSLRVTDDRGGQALQAFDLDVLADVQAPRVRLSLSGTPALIGDPVTLTVSATDNVRVQTLAVTLDGAPLVLDDRGRVTIVAAQLGHFDVVATATDPSGNNGVASRSLDVIDPTDVNAPVVSITAPAPDAVLTARTSVLGTVTDDNLLFYTLEVAPLAGGPFRQIFRGTTPVVDGVLGRFDPTVLANDAYVLRLSARDAGGHVSTAERALHVSGNLKPGDFTVSFIDLAVPVAGVPLTVARTYDTLEAGQEGELGFGWKMDFLNVAVRTSVKRTFDEDVGIFNPFEDGTRVTLTLPDGTRQGFTFAPTVDEKVLRSTFGFVDFIFAPRFVPDPGVTSELTVPGVFLVRSNGKYFVFGPSGVPYNPADPMHGGRYFLETKYGVTYEIDAATSRIQRISTHDGTLDVTPGGLLSSDGPQVLFERDARGRIARVVDPAGQAVAYTYDAAGDLVAVTDREGHTTRLAYDSPFPHYLTQIVDPLGRSGFHSEYDAEGRLTRSFDGEGHPFVFEHRLDENTDVIFDANGHPTTYRYDDRGNLLERIDALGGHTLFTVDADGNVTSETDPLGHTVTLTYDEDGNLLTSTDPLGRTTLQTYNEDSHVTAIVDALGDVTTFAYDDRHNGVGRTDALGHTFALTYQGARPSGGSYPDGAVFSVVRDKAGNIARRINADGSVAEMTWDANRNLLSETVHRTMDGVLTAVTTRYEYDRNGRVTAVVLPDDTPGDPTDNPRQRTEYDASGQVTATVDELGRRTEFTYDLNGRRTRVTYPDGTFVTWTYDLQGNAIAFTDQLGRTTRQVYDELNRLVRTIAPDDTPADPTDNPAAQRVYDAAGRLVAEIDPLGQRTDYEYDAAGQLTRMLLPAAIDATTGLFTRPVVAYTYDGRGLRTSMVDPAGGVWRYETDALGQPTAVAAPDGSTTKTAYDAMGRVLSRTDALGRTTHYAYDARGNLTSVTLPAPAPGAEAPVYRYEYDEAGLLAAVTDPLGRVTRDTYDIRGRLVAHTLPGGEVSTLAYDAASQVIARTDENGQLIRIDHDALGRISRERFADGVEHRYTYTATGQLATVTTPDGVETYTYSALDQLVSATDLFGQTIEYDYDAAGHRVALTTSSGTTRYTYDPQNRLDSVTAPDGGVTTYGYDVMGQLVRTERANGTVETRAYDDAYRLVFVGDEDASGTVLGAFTYTVDAAGRRTSLTEAGGRAVLYAYDDLDRLVRESIADPATGARTIAYTYDLAGNRLSRSDSTAGVTTYAYDADDRLLSETTGSATTTYTYDDNGAVLERRTAPDDVTTYTWDARQRLVEAHVTTPAGDQAVQYVYGADGIMVSREVDGSETRYLVDRNRPFAQVLEERTTAGAVEASYVYGLDLVSQTRGGETSFYLADAHGTTRALTDADGEVTDTYVYDAFGNLLASTGTTDNPHLFSGERRDAVTGLDYLRLRHLDPASGRFLGQDSAPGDLGMPLTLHRYADVNNDPVNRSDPSGAETEIDLAISGAIVGENASLATPSYLSYFCRFSSTLDLIQKGLQLASLVSFVSFNFNDALDRLLPVTADDAEARPLNAGIQSQFKWKNEVARKGDLETFTFKLSRDLSQELKLSVSIGFKGEVAGSFSATIDPFEKFFDSIQLSIGQGIPLAKIYFCGKSLEIGKIELAPKGTFQFTGQFSFELAYKATDKTGLLEFSFPFLKAVSPFPPHKGSLQLAGITVLGG